MKHCGGCGYLREYHVDDRCPETKTKRWQEPEPPDRRDYRQIIAEDAARRRQVIEDARKPYVVPERKPPQVAPRRPYGQGELASYRKGQAAGLGRKAVAAGWSVRALYWRAWDGAEGCGVWLERGELRALATWRRAAGHLQELTGWSADIAYGWRVGQIPMKVGIADIERVIQG